MITKIISGGQTGVDQGALNFCLDNGFDCGGWCPKGRLCEIGVIPEHFPLQEMKTTSYRKRTEQNVKDSDGTLILYRNELTGKGTLLTIELCKTHSRPYFILNLTEHVKRKKELRTWIDTKGIQTLNVAGSRESLNPGISVDTYKALFNLFSDLCKPVAKGSIQV